MDKKKPPLIRKQLNCNKKKIATANAQERKKTILDYDCV